MDFKKLQKGVVRFGKEKLTKDVLHPLNDLLDENLAEITTTIGSFIIKQITGRFTRSISFSVGHNRSDRWMEDSLFGILYKYNDIKKKSNNLELGDIEDKNVTSNGNGMYYRLADGSHYLKYRNYDIILIVRTTMHPTGRQPRRDYQIITYNLDKKFVSDFEKDMLIHRNDLLKIKADSSTVNLYVDYPGDGANDAWWQTRSPIPKRTLNTIYLPKDIKRKLINTINNYFASREEYKKHGIPWNLKILLHGKAGVGKDSVSRMIASEYSRNIFYINGRGGGKSIPTAITTDDPNFIINPLFLISDIDKFPFLINEADVDLTMDGKDKEQMISYKQMFGKMINALDGVMSGEGKIIIMSTNHIEKFSPTFLRPGRIDLILELPCVTPEVFRKWTYDHYHQILPKDIKLKSDEFKISEMQHDLLFYKLTAEEFISKYCK